MTSSLNPNAQEWKPFSKPQCSHHPQLPHVIYSLSSPAASSLPPHTAPPLVAFLPSTAAPHQTPIYQLPQQFSYYQPVVLHQPCLFPARRSEVFSSAWRSEVFSPRMRGGVKFSPLPKRKAWSPVKSTFSDGNGAAPPRSQSSEEYSTYTTVMVKNIPNQLRRDFMLKYLDQYCKEYSLEYDFMYLPMDFKKCDNYGYAFVNFTNAAAASKFKEIAQGFKWGTVQTNRGLFTSKKVLDITWATIQGKEALIRRFKESNFTCKRMDYLPVVLDPPRNGLDPNPPLPVTIGKLQQYWRRA